MFIAGFCNCMWCLLRHGLDNWMGLIYKTLFEESQTKATLNLFLPDGKIVFFFLGFKGICFKHVLKIFPPK